MKIPIESVSHFYTWLLFSVPEAEQGAIEHQILEALGEYPDLIERGLSWPEIAEYGSQD